MPQVNVFNWRAGAGWIVLSGGGPIDSDDVNNIEARMLQHTVSQGPIAYVWAASDLEAADRHMDSLRELGARTGYLVDVVLEEDDALRAQLSEAGVVILGDGSRIERLYDAMSGVVLRGIEEAFRRGATIYAVGQSAAMLGALVPAGDGFGWLANAVIMPAYTAQQADQLRDGVLRQPGGYGLGIAAGAALALGPQGEVEVWGNASITISLGQDFTPGE
ncbi:MAG: hypothetical protein GYB65_10070 [Chloroflexi bacterium]|nr:hypothetical protein [Chloroflexota bacterium]